MDNKSVRSLPFHRPVVLGNENSFAQAAHAMETNNIGSVLVKNKQGDIIGIVTDRDLAFAFALQNIQKEDHLSKITAAGEISYVTETATREDVITLMRQKGVRRVPIMREVSGRPSICMGVISLDDLIRAELIESDEEREILQAQLAENPRQSDNQLRAKTAFRHQDRKQQSYFQFMSKIAHDTGLSRGDARNFTLYMMTVLLRRITSQEGKDLLSQFPYILQAELISEISAPDRAFQATDVVKEMSERLGRTSLETVELMRRFWQSLTELVSPGEMKDVAAQLPQDLKENLALA